VAAVRGITRGNAAVLAGREKERLEALVARARVQQKELREK
jgi:hypothetical protein